MNDREDERREDETKSREPYERPAIEESARFETLALTCDFTDPEICLSPQS